MNVNLRPATHRVYVTNCMGCGRRLHGPSEEALVKRAARHGRNCMPLLKRGVAIPVPDAPSSEGFEGARGGGES